MTASEYEVRAAIVSEDFRLTFWSMILAYALGRAGRFEEALVEASAAARRDGRLYTARVVVAWVL